MSVSGKATIRFFHGNGRANIRGNLESLLAFASSRLQVAVCFFRGADLILFSKYINRLAQADSFVVVSVAWPTDLDALAQLHKLARNNVYIHLGGVTPEEWNVGRALMHTKVFLADQGAQSRLWVGSHNLTAQAVEGGNFEAALEYDAPSSDPEIISARQHLLACRDSAELFDPSQLTRYREIQGRTRPRIGRKAGILVIHAEAQVMPGKAPFTVHVRAASIRYDDYFTTDGEVHLYLYKQNSLKQGARIPIESSSLYKGVVTGVHFTQKNPRNRGIKAELPTAEYEIDLQVAPVFFAAGGPYPEPVTQAVLRLDTIDSPGHDLYSLSSEPLLSAPILVDTGEEILSPTHSDMKRFFTPNSVAGENLIYRPVIGTKRDLQIAGYQENALEDREIAIDLERAGIVGLSLVSKTQAAEEPIDPFFFVSRYHLSRR